MIFHQFANLPPEIRLQIWTSTLPGPRHIGPITTVPPRPSLRKRRMPWQEDPVALRVNRESREVALLHYRPRNVAHLKRWERKDDIKYPNYIDHRVDFASFSTFQSFDFLIHAGTHYDFNSLFFSRHEMARMERLWLAHENISDLGRDICLWIDRWLSYFPKLKEMIVEVRKLKGCGGVVLEGVFLTVGEALQIAQSRGRDRLVQSTEEMMQGDALWQMPVLEVEAMEKLLLQRRSRR